MSNPIRNEWRAVMAATRLLTRIPVPLSMGTSGDDIRRGVRYFPVVGILIGAVAASSYVIAAQALPATVAALISTVATILATGALHEDGLADTSDGIGGGRERALEVMRDSRIGTYGVLALMLVVGTKVVSIASLPMGTAITALIAAHIISRASVVVAMFGVNPARNDGLGARFGGGASIGSVFVAIFVAAAALVAVALLVSWVAATFVAVASVIGHVAIRATYQPKIGGYTGDTLGATQQITEVCIYIASAATLNVAG